MSALLEEQCDLLRSLHVLGKPLVLPNAWDAASARAVVEAGFPVVATSSGAVADSLGYEDEHGAPAVEMFAAAGRIVRAVDVPVTVDAEAGYGMEPDELVEALAEVGAAGCNLEDTDHAAARLKDPDGHAAWLRDVRNEADKRNYGLVVNARVDVFLSDRERPQADLLDSALARARAYLAAGADCVFPIFMSDEDTIRAFVDAVGAPVNVLGIPQAPPIPRLAELGVARVSFGSGPMRRAMAALSEFLSGLRT